MSFALTRAQIEDRTKTVTRRTGWNFLKVGDVLNAVNKTMGFKKGEKPERLARIRVVSVRREPLKVITPKDVIAEGFGQHSYVEGKPYKFVRYFCNANRKCTSDTVITRIEFEYL